VLDSTHLLVTTEGSKDRWQDDIKTDLRKQDARADKGFKRLRLGSDDEVL